MASTQDLPPKTRPLHMMKPLSSAIFIHEPTSEAAQGPSCDTKGPRFILLFSWYEAQDAHVVKYINQHIALYPAARILLVKCPFTRMLPFTSRQLQPAVDALRAFADTFPGGGGDGLAASQLLIHSFSNGGGYNFTRFTRLWQQKTGGPLPPHVTVIDSAPDRFAWSRGLTTITAPVPWYLRPVAKAVVAVVLAVMGISLGGRALTTISFEELYSMAILEKEARRTYIYSKEDPMVAYEDVELHAQKAEQKSKVIVVRKEMFVGSGHVAHVRVDAERYWRIVRETCEG